MYPVRSHTRRMAFWNRSKTSTKAVPLEGTGHHAFFIANGTVLQLPTGLGAAFECTASRGAIFLICQTVATLPVHLFARGDGNERERASEHPAEKLIAHRAAPWMTAAEFRREMTLDALWHGNAYARVIRVGDVVRELQRIRPDAVTLMIDRDSGEPAYKVQLADGGEELLTYGDILHLQALRGRSTIKDVMGAIELALALEGHGRKIFKNGAMPSGIIRVPSKLSEENAKKVAESFAKRHSGENSGGIAVLEDGVTFEPIGMSSTDAEHNAQRQIQIEEIARGFGVPPILIQAYGRATWGNASEVGRLFLQYGLSPWLQAWQDAYATALLTEDEQTSHFVEFNADAITKAELKARYEAFAKAGAGAAWMTPNELRALDNRPAIDGGDELRQPLNTSTQNQEAREDG